MFSPKPEDPSDLSPPDELAQAGGGRADPICMRQLLYMKQFYMHIHA